MCLPLLLLTVSLLPLVGEGDGEQGVLASLDLRLGLTDSQQVV